MFGDDIKIIGPKGSEFIEKVKDAFIAALLIINMGPISFYLGLKVNRD